MDKQGLAEDERLAKRHVYQTVHGAFCMSEEEYRLYEEHEEMEGLLASGDKQHPSQERKARQA